jgi:hypothetical protein
MLLQAKLQWTLIEVEPHHEGPLAGAMTSSQHVYEVRPRKGSSSCVRRPKIQNDPHVSLYGISKIIG